MDNYKFYHFLSAKVDLENGFKKIKNGEVLDKIDEEALRDILNMVIGFIAEESDLNKSFIEYQ